MSRIRNFIMLSGMFGSFVAQGQTISPAAINASGGSKDIGGNTYEYSIGEMTLVHTASTANIVVTQGLLQPAETASTDVADLTLPADMLTVYPNPFEDMIYIQPNAQGGAVLTLTLMDITGRRIHQQDATLESGNEKQSIRLSAIAAGTYMLQAVVTHSNQNRVGNFKIQKLK